MEKRLLILKAGTENPHPVSGIEYPIPECLENLRKHADVMVIDDENEKTILDAIDGVGILMITYGQVTRKVIEAGLPTLKAVIKLGTGIDSIDIETAKKYGVRVINCPDYAQNAVAEGAFLLLMNCLKKFSPIHCFVNRHGWMGPSEENKGRNLEKKMVGLVGLGHINSRFANMCKGFDMELQAYDPYVNQKNMEKKNITKVEHLDDLMTSSDVVAICLPLNSETEGLISERRLRLMKSSAFLINVSRGAIVDEQALLKLLKEGSIAGCGLDVFSDEPLLKEGHPLSELLSMDQVVITPHLAAWTHETWEQLQLEVYRNVMDILEGRDSVIVSSDPRLKDQAGCVYPNQQYK